MTSTVHLIFGIRRLSQWFSTCGGWTSSVSITWELVGIADSQTPPRLSGPETLVVEPSNLPFNKASRYFWWTQSNVWKQLIHTPWCTDMAAAPTCVGCLGPTYGRGIPRSTITFPEVDITWVFQTDITWRNVRLVFCAWLKVVLKKKL